MGYDLTAESQGDPPACAGGAHSFSYLAVEMRRRVQQLFGWSHQTSQSSQFDALVLPSQFDSGTSNLEKLTGKYADRAGSSLAGHIRLPNLVSLMRSFCHHTSIPAHQTLKN
ncbi:MAG: hypothetical protein SOI56_04225 [Eubacteriales bacterium]|jgi:hypothetical protein